MKQMPRIAAGMACVSVLLAGCQMNVITEIEASGAGRLTTEVGMTPDEVAQVQSLAGGEGDSPCAFFSSSQTGLAHAPVFEEQSRGEDTWCVAAIDFADMDELAALYQEMDFVKIRELTVREGLVVYDLELDAQATDLGMTPGETTWVLVLPGRLGSHNADSVDGKRLTWTLAPGAVTEVRASSDLLTPGLPFGLGGSEAAIMAAVACACCGGVLLVVVLAVLLLLRRKRPQTVEDGGLRAPPSGG